MTLKHKISKDLHQGLKTAARRAIKAAGGVEIASTDVRVNKTSLSEYGNQNIDKYMPLDVAVELEEITGTKYITEYLVHRNGGVFLPLNINHNDTSWALRLANLGKETSDVFAKTQEFLKDDKIDSKEAEKLITEVQEAITVLAKMHAALERKL